MKIYTAEECPQGSDLWWTARRGLPTASGFGRIITSKGNLSKGADKYIAELISDIACLNPPYFTTQGRPVTFQMKHGTDCEPEARRWFEMEKGVTVQQVGFVHNGLVGCSPDGLIGDDGGLELKCPMLKTHAEYLMKGRLPPVYKAQVHGNLIVTERKYWWFLSYAPGLHPLLIRVEPDEFTAKLRQALDVFVGKFQEAKAKLLGVCREPGEEG